MSPTTSSTGGGPSRYLESRDLQLSSSSQLNTLCGNILNSAAAPSGVKNTVIGGIILIDKSCYAMTSAYSLANAQHPYKVQFESEKLDWALCKINPILARWNVYDSGPLLRYMQEDELEHTTGPVEVIVGFGSYKANLVSDGDTTISGFGHDVRMRAVVTTLPKTTIIRTGAWVVKGDALCGYVVHSEPQWEGSGRVGYLVPIWQAFKEIEATTGKKVVFGKELHDILELPVVVGRGGRVRIG